MCSHFLISWGQHDSLPNSLVVYFMPKACGTEFSFPFKPHFGMRAHATPSVLFCNYNPESQAVMALTEFIVR